MPKHLLPRRNTPHRVAAIALYRALLSQSRSLPSSSQEQRDAIQNIIRNRFKQAEHLESPRLLKINFEAGYEAIDHLDAAVGGNDRSRAYILDLLQRSPAKVKEPKPAPVVPKRKKASTSEDHKNESENELPRINLFDRPLPLEKLSGKRHVPVLFNANHIPVLRLKKPQPASLSNFIRQRIEQRQEWHNRRHRLQNELVIARCEDGWDELISHTGLALGDVRSEVHGDQEPQWQDAILEANSDVDAKLTAETNKYQAMATKMQAVVDREQALYNREKAERRDALNAEKAASEEIQSDVRGRSR
jgi:hypothetical protein